MSRRVKHKCRHSEGGDGAGFYSPCTGKWAEWSGRALFCTTCGAWQRDRFRKPAKIHIDRKKVEVKAQPFDFGFQLAAGFVPEPEPEWHHSSLATNMVLARKYRQRVKAAHDKYVAMRHWNSYARKVGVCLDHGNALPCDECD